MIVFIAGPRVIKKLDENIFIKLDNIFDKKYSILVGDADGVDSSVQKYLHQKAYKNVKIFASNGIARNNYGNWPIEQVNVDSKIRGFDFYVQKDLEMVKKADIGFMIWNGESKGTLNNMINLLNLEKEVILYYVSYKKFYHIKNISELINFLNANVKLNNKLQKLLPQFSEKQYKQACLF